MSKFLSTIINKSIDHSKYNINNSYSFQQFITDQMVPEGHRIISLDVVSLFTNIPIDLALRIIGNRWTSIKQNTNIPFNFFMEMVTLCLRHNYFSFKNKFHQQIEGTPMGSCISPSSADLVLDEILDLAIEKLPFRHLFVKKYVDDLIMAVPEKSIQVTLDTFNSINCYIQFTTECEVNNVIPFLDMAIIRKDNGAIITE